MDSNTIQSLHEAYQKVFNGQLDEGGMNPSATPAAKEQTTKAAADFFTKPKKPLPPYEAKKPRFGALTIPDFDLGTKKPESKSPVAAPPKAKKPTPDPAAPPKAETPVAAPPKAKKPTPAPAAPPKAETPKTEAPKPTETPKVEAPKPKGGEVAMSKIGDKSDYSVAATAKMSDRTKTILGTKDSETGKTIRKPQFGATSARERALNQNLDLFDIIKGYLLDEGYAETEKSAIVIMANMSEEWKRSILDS